MRFLNKRHNIIHIKYKSVWLHLNIKSEVLFVKKSVLNHMEIIPLVRSVWPLAPASVCAFLHYMLMNDAALSAWQMTLLCTHVTTLSLSRSPFLIYLPRISLALVIKALGCICLLEKGAAGVIYSPTAVRIWGREKTLLKRETSLLSSRAPTVGKSLSQKFKTRLGNTQVLGKRLRRVEKVFLMPLIKVRINLLVLIGRCGIYIN